MVSNTDRPPNKNFFSVCCATCLSKKRKTTSKQMSTNPRALYAQSMARRDSLPYHAGPSSGPVTAPHAPLVFGGMVGRDVEGLRETATSLPFPLSLFAALRLWLSIPAKARLGVGGLSMKRVRLALGALAVLVTVGMLRLATGARPVCHHNAKNCKYYIKLCYCWRRWPYIRGYQFCHLSYHFPSLNILTLIDAIQA